MLKTIPLKGIKVEKRGFFNNEGGWVSLNNRAILPNGFNGSLLNQKAIDLKRAKEILFQEYQKDLAQLYRETFPEV